MRSRILAIAALAAAAPHLFAAAPITIVVVDPPGVGFNDQAPAMPVGGNSGTTVGEQRLIAFQYAAGIWSSKIDSPVPIRIRASFQSLPCTADTGIAGEAGPVQVFAFSQVISEVYPDVWYPAALANKLADMVLDPSHEEIHADFNGDLGKPGCIPNRKWYYGLDTQDPDGGFNLVTLLLHELGHGLGFLPTSNAADGSRFAGRADVFTQYVFDTSTAKSWNEMTDAERKVSFTNTDNVVWSGINVRRDAPKVLQRGLPILRIREPESIARDITMVRTSEFGPRLTSSGVSGELVVALDVADDEGPSETDACSPLLNGSAIAGRIALVDRGSCPLIVKALNAQAAGAIALVMVNNVEGFPFVLDAPDPEIVIPTVYITLADGKALRTSLASSRMSALLLADPMRLRGVDEEGRPLLYVPGPGGPFSPIGHWDPRATPNQLMAPVVIPDVGHSVEPPNDLTLSLLRDLGWFSDFDGVPDGIDQCPNSERGDNLMIQKCDTGVSNKTSPNGCRVSDSYKPCNSAGTQGDFAACVDSVSRDLLRLGTIARNDADRIQGCAAKTVIP